LPRPRFPDVVDVDVATVVVVVDAVVVVFGTVVVVDAVRGRTVVGTGTTVDVVVAASATTVDVVEAADSSASSSVAATTAGVNDPARTGADSNRALRMPAARPLPATSTAATAVNVTARSRQVRTGKRYALDGQWARRRPGRGQRHASTRPVADRVMYAVRMSTPPQQMLVGTGS
jgi:hypothetical protein